MVFHAILILGTVFSQLSSNDNSSMFNSTNGNFDKRVPVRYVESTSSIDNSISDSSYIVGGGDEFQISFFKTSITYRGIVNQNCDLFVPEMGIIPLGSVPLSTAKETIVNYFAANSKKNVYVSLIKSKVVSMQIAGAVTNPGTYNVSGMYRLFDAVKIANNNIPPSLYLTNVREIKCINKGIIKYYDLLKYFTKGEMLQNPYVYSGDEIVLSSIQRAVFIHGQVSNIAGMVPIKSNESIGDFLKCFSFFESSDLHNIAIKRIIDGQENVIIYDIEKEENFVLNDRDVITIPIKKNYSKIFEVLIEGQVASPGSYPITESPVLANALLSQAGGISENGDINRAVIIRMSKILSKRAIVSTVRPEITTSLANSQQYKDYAVIRYGKGNVLLEPDDKIFIPKKDKYVYLSGGIKNTGCIEYVKGKNVNYYIKTAGGFIYNADKTNISIVADYGDAVVLKGKDNIEEGDIIVVPISQQNKTLATVVLPVIQAVATTVGVFLGIYAVVK